MATIIIAGCAVSLIVCGATLALAYSKRFRKAMNKWLRRVMSMEESENGDSYEMGAKAINGMDEENAVEIGYPVVKETSDGRFLFVTIVRPPASVPRSNQEENGNIK